MRSHEPDRGEHDRDTPDDGTARVPRPLVVAVAVVVLATAGFERRRGVAHVGVRIQDMHADDGQQCQHGRHQLTT